MPFIVLPDGKVFAQSGTICKFICTLAGKLFKLFLGLMKRWLLLQALLLNLWTLSMPFNRFLRDINIKRIVQYRLVMKDYLVSNV